MNAIDTTKAFLAALNAHDVNKVAPYLTDDFVFSFNGDTNKAGFLALAQMLFTAFPDIAGNYHDIREESGSVKAFQQFTGTFTGVLVFAEPLEMPDEPPIQPTGRRFSLPDEPLTLTVRGDQVVSFSVESVPGGGMRGLLAQVTG